jgi:hypothetical protein
MTQFVDDDSEYCYNYSSAWMSWDSATASKMDRWCEENIGEYGKIWYNDYSRDYTYIRWCFFNQEELAQFLLTWY